MDIATHAELVLRRAGYDTWTWPGAATAVTCFENAAIIGFVHVFPSADRLLAGWEEAQRSVLARHSPALRAAGAKAWNVYSVFLAEGQAPTTDRAVARIDEDFALTRKIARAGVRTLDDVERALLPLIAIKSAPVLSEADFQDRLRARLGDVSEDVLTAFFSATGAADVATILEESP